ncbi:MAG: PEP-utilizing enzyme [Candidatus Binatia bacterium]
MSTEPSWKEAEGWRRDAVHYPARPLRPLDVSFVIETVGPGSGIGFAEWSLPIEHVADKTVHGWVYIRMVPAGDPPEAAIRLMSKARFLGRLWRLIPPLRRRILGFDRFLAEGGFEAHIPTWETVWRPEAERRLDSLRRLDVRTAGPAEVAAQLESWHEYLTWQWSPHIRIHLVCSYVRGRFAEVCARLLGLDELDAYELVKRSDPVLLEPSHRLSVIAQRAAGDPAARTALEQGAEDAHEALRGTWFDRELEAFLDAHGDVPVDGFEPSLPTWREQPHRVVALVQQLMRAGIDPEAADASFEAVRKRRIDELRGRLSGDDRAEFDRWLELAERAYPLNDNHNHLLFELPVGLTRYAALRAGELLVDGGQLADPADVFFLSLDELTSALRDGSDVRPLIAPRRQAHEWSLTLDPPEFPRPVPPPPTDTLPPRVADTLRVLLDQTDKMYGTVGTQADGASVLVGLAGSPGVAEGRVCLVTNVRELDKVREGDVLVCPITGPAWTAVFPIISGLVTEAGGPLSHPAIVAREFGIPSVVGTGTATRTLRDGQLVRVDGTNARVEIL